MTISLLDFFIVLSITSLMVALLRKYTQKIVSHLTITLTVAVIVLLVLNATEVIKIVDNTEPTRIENMSDRELDEYLFEELEPTAAGSLDKFIQDKTRFHEKFER